MAKIQVIHGPNIDMLGKRQPLIYGEVTLEEINQSLQVQSKGLGHDLTSFQSNAEHEHIDYLHRLSDSVDLIIINPAGFTHTSVALLDALLATQCPYIEVHLSNIYSREDFRAHSFFSQHALGVISGFKEKSYFLALEAASEFLVTV